MKTNLAILLLFNLFIIVSCAPPRIQITPLPENSKISARLNRVYVKSFDKWSIKKNFLANFGMVETVFQDNLVASFKQSNLFDHTANERLQVRAELLSWDYSNNKMQTVVKYLISDEYGKLIWEGEISSEEVDGNFFMLLTGPYRHVISATKSFNKNISFLFEQLKKDLSPIWMAYKKDREKSLKQIAADSSYESLIKHDLTMATDKRDFFGNYYALIIGNNNYWHLPELKTAINDSLEIAKVLQEKYNFNVNIITDATRGDVLRELNNYRSKLGYNDNFLIYYAGHGWLDKATDEGYWLPVDATRKDPTNWVSNFSITSALKAMNAKHVLVISDSCYSGKLARGIHLKRLENQSDYFKRIARKRCRTVLASGGLEPVLDSGGTGSHSVFASALLNALTSNNGFIDTTSIFEQIRRSIVLNSDQTPEYSDIRKAGHDGGDFIFISR